MPIVDAVQTGLQGGMDWCSGVRRVHTCNRHRSGAMLLGPPRPPLHQLAPAGLQPPPPDPGCKYVHTSVERNTQTLNGKKQFAYRTT